jgi:hypothetical protein
MVMRALVVLVPQMYRQAISFFLSSERPGIEVKSANPLDLERECALFDPHLLICHDGVSEDARNRAFCLIEIRYSDGMDAVVKANGRVSRRIEDIEMEDLLAIVDETAKVISPKSD